MPSQYPDQTHSVLLTNVNGTDENVLCYTTLSVDTLAAAYTGRLTWDEMYVVPPADRQYYLAEVTHLTLAEEERARRLASVAV